MTSTEVFLRATSGYIDKFDDRKPHLPPIYKTNDYKNFHVQKRLQKEKHAAQRICSGERRFYTNTH